MEDVSELLDGIGSIAWPLIVLLLLIVFRSPIKSVIESAKGRKFTIKVGDNELTMEEATEQQRKLINDLQEKILALESPIAAKSAHDEEKIVVQSDAKSGKADLQGTILWVDDKPSNNSYEIAHLQDAGVNVVPALSTNQALALFQGGKYDRIITDMGRMEAKTYNPAAGIDLIQSIRKIDKDIPILVYTSSSSIRRYGQESLNAGANKVTNSATTLLNTLNIPKLRRSAS